MICGDFSDFNCLNYDFFYLSDFNCLNYDFFDLSDFFDLIPYAAEFGGGFGLPRILCLCNTGFRG